ncbi:metallophosphoesterase [Aureibacter tunicatorum]
MGISSCELLDYTRYDISLEDNEKDLNQKNLQELSQRPGIAESGNFTFAFITDSQNFFDRLTNAVKHVNNNESYEFALIGGDISEYGMPYELQMSAANLRELNQPFISVIGNHDAIGHGAETFEKMFGPFDFSFVYKRVKIIMINTNKLEFIGNATYEFLKVPDIDWLESELVKTDDFDYSLIVSHIGFYPNDPSIGEENFPLIDTLLSNTEHLVACIHGHGHSNQTTYPLMNKDIPMIQVGAVANKSYSIFEFLRDSVEVKEQIIKF